MNNHSLSAGGTPMIEIDGAKVRSLREQKGLTQLYIATVVGVTTDTISRWENKRYSNIKKENAFKLAEALEVPLDELLQQQAESSPEKTEAPHDQGGKEDAIEPPSPPARLNTYRRPLIVLLIAVSVLAVFWRFYGTVQLPFVSARRVMPAHVPPGQTFPVMIEVETKRPGPVSLILKEIVPTQCEVLAAQPVVTVQNKTTGVLKWISKTEDKKIVFAYLAQCGPKLALGDSLHFEGSVTMSKALGRSVAIDGNSTLVISAYHWADTNEDGVIDDKEILSVYETFGSVSGLQFDIDQIEEIWAGTGYKWDQARQEYIVNP